jgi:hypothetical protein
MPILDFSARHKPMLGPKHGETDTDLDSFLQDYASMFIAAYRSYANGDMDGFSARRATIFNGVKKYADRVFSSYIDRASVARDSEEIRHSFHQAVLAKLTSEDFFNQAFSGLWPSNSPVPEDLDLSEQAIKTLRRLIQTIVHNSARVALGVTAHTPELVSLEKAQNIAEEGADPESQLSQGTAAEQAEKLRQFKFRETTIGGFIEAYVDSALKGGTTDVAEIVSKTMARITGRFKDVKATDPVVDSSLPEWVALKEKGYADTAGLADDVASYVDTILYARKYT